MLECGTPKSRRIRLQHLRNWLSIKAGNEMAIILRVLHLGANAEILFLA